MKLSFYTPIAYDYKYSIASIISYYDIADEIILGIDKDRISWSNKKYDFDNNDFFQQIKKIDIDKKIKLIEDNFHLYSEPIKNDTYERNYISKICKKGNYIIGIDSDEILLNPNEFKIWFEKNKIEYDISCNWLTVYKIFDKKCLITQPDEITIIGTKLVDSFKKSRFTFRKYIYSPLSILHFSWGRKRKDIEQKLLNWSHSKDFDIQKHLEIWDCITLDNYKEKTNLHPLNIQQWWKSLKLLCLDDFNLSTQIINRLSTI